ncbi:hypothetical protein [Psychromonas algicola]|uniref:hypothetical protein n=1 Tax=Psychromonas algicola TaxID=2555642 RepID=UPI001067E899|nr:hypothetical protein [Psychromonas sp. RZ5]TEW51715.1 hypothetical protein E2R67_05715 [Psychromonas sp. RZ5]
MDVLISNHIDHSALRSHPWTKMQTDDESVYMDFKQHPNLIRTALEDLIPYKKWDFVEQFYTLIEWINSQDCLLESNDCTFNAIEDNSDKQYAYAKKCSARLMILFRDIPENCQEKSITWLLEKLQSLIAASKPKFKAGAIGLSLSPTCYLALGDTPDTGGMGHQLTLNFFAYGKNERRCYENMKEILIVAEQSLKRINKSIQLGELDKLYTLSN